MDVTKISHQNNKPCPPLFVLCFFLLSKRVLTKAPRIYIYIHPSAHLSFACPCPFMLLCLMSMSSSILIFLAKFISFTSQLETFSFTTHHTTKSSTIRLISFVILTLTSMPTVIKTFSLQLFTSTSFSDTKPTRINMLAHMSTITTTVKTNKAFIMSPVINTL